MRDKLSNVGTEKAPVHRRARQWPPRIEDAVRKEVHTLDCAMFNAYMTGTPRPDCNCGAR